MKLPLIQLFLLLSVLVLKAAPPDSLGVKIINGQQYIIHEVQPAQGYYAISRLYNVPIVDIRRANPDLGNIIPLGSLVFVPVLKKPQTALETLPSDVVVHRVKEGETLFSISQQYNVTVEKVKDWNSLESDTIQLDQRLYLFPHKEETFMAVPAARSKSIDSVERVLIVEAASNYKSEFEAMIARTDDGKLYKGQNWKKIQEAVIAGWIDDGSLISDKFLALHINAPSGTILKVTNPMNGRTAFVKVVGGLPKTDGATQVQVKLTKSLIKKLGVLDEFFLADIEYFVIR